MSIYEDEDYIDEMRQERYEQHRRRRNLSCSDGFCGATDCQTCYPHHEWNNREEEDNG